MLGTKNSSPTGIPSGSRAEFVHESITTAQGISRDITELLNKHMAIHGQVESAEEMMHLAYEVRELVNKMLDSMEK